MYNPYTFYLMYKYLKNIYGVYVNITVFKIYFWFYV